MGRINVGRVVLGGLLAGLVINVSETVLNLVVVAQQMEEVLRARNLPPAGGGMIAGFVLNAFVLGIATVWLYAAIRPKFGAGPRTAAIAGAAVWFFTYFYGAVTYILMGFLPAKVTTVATLWGLPEIIVAAIAGAWIYTE
jgi:hypothetical protein